MKFVFAVVLSLLGIACLGAALCTIFIPLDPQMTTDGCPPSLSVVLSGFRFALPLAVFFFAGAWWLYHRHRSQKPAD